MEIIKHQQDLVLTLTVKIEEQDYLSDVEQKLKQYRKNANIPGFRVGMAPMSLVNKMYKTSLVGEETYKIANSKVADYLVEKDIKTIGNLLLSDKQEPINPSTAVNFEYIFEIGVSPDFELDLSKIEVVKYSILESAEDKEKIVDSFLTEYGQLVDVEMVEKDEAVEGLLENEDKSVSVENAYIGLVSLSDKVREEFKGKKVGDVVKVNVEEVFPVEKNRLHILGLTSEEFAETNKEFSIKIEKVRQFKKGELTETLLAEKFPNGEVKTLEDFDKYVSEIIENRHKEETDMRFALDSKESILKQVNIELPQDYLKRWLFAINEGKYTMEQIESEFNVVEDQIKWDLIQNDILTKGDVKFSEADVLGGAISMTKRQYAYYGMHNIPQEQLEEMAKKMLHSEKDRRNVEDFIKEERVISLIKSGTKVKEKEISTEEFRKLYEKKA